MDIDFAFVCDYADSGNKLNALGIGFDTIYAPQVPCVHPHFHLVLQLRSSVAEAGHKDVNVNLVDADGKHTVPTLSGTMEIRQPPPGVSDTTGRLVVGFDSILFPAYGHYTLQVVVQDREMVRIPIRVAQPPTTG